MQRASRLVDSFVRLRDMNILSYLSYIFGVYKSTGCLRNLFL